MLCAVDSMYVARSKIVWSGEWCLLVCARVCLCLYACGCCDGFYTTRNRGLTIACNGKGVTLYTVSYLTLTGERVCKDGLPLSALQSSARTHARQGSPVCRKTVPTSFVCMCVCMHGCTHAFIFTQERDRLLYVGIGCISGDSG